MKKLVLHLQNFDEEIFCGALRMLKHFVESASGEEVKGVLLVTGSAVKRFKKGDLCFPEIMTVLETTGLKIELCHNAMQQHQVLANDLSATYTIVPAGVYELVKLQEAGYAYVKA